MLLKICGITRAEDAFVAANNGATAIGFVFWPVSPRCVEIEMVAEIVQGLPADVIPVGVFVNASIETIEETVERASLGAVQLHGEESAAETKSLRWPIFRSATVKNAAGVRASWPTDTVILLDADDPAQRGGTGRVVDWRGATEIAKKGRILLAGGLTPENVDQAITAVRPFGVDVSSGVETAPGIKSSDKMVLFLKNARRAFEKTAGL
jgi:phosphoribosylanthranilate isomerase